MGIFKSLGNLVGSFANYMSSDGNQSSSQQGNEGGYSQPKPRPSSCSVCLHHSYVNKQAICSNCEYAKATPDENTIYCSCDKPGALRGQHPKWNSGCTIQISRCAFHGELQYDISSSCGKGELRI